MIEPAVEEGAILGDGGRDEGANQFVLQSEAMRQGRDGETQMLGKGAQAEPAQAVGLDKAHGRLQDGLKVGAVPGGGGLVHEILIVIGRADHTSVHDTNLAQ